MGKCLGVISIVGLLLSLASISWAQDSGTAAPATSSSGHHHHRKDAGSSQSESKQ
jgi:hypothetical protein